MASLAELHRLMPSKFRWEDLGFELDNMEEGFDDEWSR
jgi:hypothetical protein